MEALWAEQQLQLKEQFMIYYRSSEGLGTKLGFLVSIKSRIYVH